MTKEVGHPIYHDMVRKKQWKRLEQHFQSDPIELITQKDQSGKTFLEYTDASFKKRLLEVNNIDKSKIDYQKRSLFVLQTALNQSHFAVFDKEGALEHNCVFGRLLDEIIKLPHEIYQLELKLTDIVPGCNNHKTFFTYCYERSGEAFLQFLYDNIDLLHQYGISRSNILTYFVQAHVSLIHLARFFELGIQLFPDDLEISDLKTHIKSFPESIVKRKVTNTLSLFEQCDDHAEFSKIITLPYYSLLFNKVGNTLLLECAIRGYETETIQLMKSEKSTFNTINEEYNSIWHIAAKMNLPLVFDFLKENDPNIESRNANGETPWMVATLEGHVECARKMLSKKANSSVVINEQGHTLLHNAVISNDEGLLKDCLASGAILLARDFKGFTAVYYSMLKNESTIITQLKSLNDFEKALASDLHNAARLNDITSLNSLIERGVSYDTKNIKRQTPLDTALINGANDVIQYLQSIGAKHTLNASEIEMIRYHKGGVNRAVNHQYQITLDREYSGQRLFLKKMDAQGALVNEFVLDPWQYSEAVKTNERWKVITKSERCYLVLMRQDDPNQYALLCEISKNGSISLRYANMPKEGLYIKTFSTFNCEAVAQISDFTIKAEVITFLPQSKLHEGNYAKLEADSIELKGAFTFKHLDCIANQYMHQQGELLSEELRLEAGKAIFEGQIMAIQKFECMIHSTLDLQGQFSIGNQGKIKAHSVYVHRNAVIQSEKNSLDIHADCRLSISGAIVGNFVYLESGLILTINHGAMVKALSCVTKAPQFNQAGFLIVGQKTTLSYIDWGLNFAHAGVNIAEICSWLPAPNALMLRGYLLVAKTLYRGGDILYRLYKDEPVNNSEIVTLVLDNVIPSIGSLTANEEKARLLVNLLYQFYGNTLSEDDFVQKSLHIIELITQGLGTLSLGMISQENAKWLVEASNIIRNSRTVLRVADLSLSMLQSLTSQNQIELDNAHVKLVSMAEVMLRESLYSLEPAQLLGLKAVVEPRDLVLFILNQGHNSDLFLQSVVFGCLHSAGKSGLIDQDAIANLDLIARGFFRAKHWTELCKAYQDNKLTVNMVANEAINTLMLASNIYVNLSTPASTPQENNDDESITAEIAIESEANLEKEVESNLQTEQILDDETLNQDDDPLLDLTPEEIEAEHQKTLETYKQDIPEYTHIELTVDAEKIIKDNANSEQRIIPEPSLHAKLSRSLLAIQKAINGELAAHGHLGTFITMMHNEGIIDVSGDIDIDFERHATNNSLLKSTANIYLKSTIESAYTNYESGSISADEAINLICISLVNNYGTIESLRKITSIAVRVIKNHQDGHIISSDDVNLLCDELAINEGVIIGKEVQFEGTEEAARNSGTIIGAEKIRMISKGLVDHTPTGTLLSKEIIFETNHLNKEGACQANFVEPKGYQADKPESVTWRKHDDDSIGALKLNSTQPLNYDRDAFQNVSMVDVTISTPLNPESTTLFDIDPSFSNLLQVHYGHSDVNISIWQLPQMASDATLILDAPGSTLGSSGEHSNYGSTLYFVGDKFIYSSQNTIFSKPAHFDVQILKGANATSQLTLEEGGFLQAEEMSNIGPIISKDILHWNVKSLQNDAQTQNFQETFQHSKWYPIYQTVDSSKVIEGSGTIHALGHVGYIGYFAQHGGSFTSDEEGTYIYFDKSVQEAIGTTKGVNPDYAMQDTGQHWYMMPDWQNAKIGSKGQSVLIGSDEMQANGLSVWGDEGVFLYAVNGIKKGTKQSYYVIQETKDRSRSGKINQVVRSREEGYVVAENDISSDHGRIDLVAINGSIHLNNTIISAAGDVALIAHDEVSVNPEMAEHRESSKYKKRGLLKSKSVSSSTEEQRIYSSFIFSGGTLFVRCTDFTLDSVSGVLGAADIVANTTTFKGKKQTYHNKTVTKEFSITPPGDGLLSILRSHNAKAVFQSIMNNMGWDQQELENLLNAKSVGEIPKPMLNVSRNAWNITALVAHACNEWGGSPANFVGTFTDQMGITTIGANGKRIFNPKFSLNQSKLTEETTSSQTISTDLYVGGTFRLVGNQLHLLDGSQVDAEHLRVFLTEGIHATKAVDTYAYSSHMKSHSLGINPLDLTDVSVGVNRSSNSQAQTTTRLAGLHARRSAFVKAQSKIQGELQITGETGEISAPEMEFSSAQDTFKEKGKSFGANVNTKGLVSAQAQKSYIDEATTNQKAGIQLRSGKVLANEIQLNQGSKIETEILAREDGEDGLPTVTGTASHDHSKSKSIGGGFSFAPQGEPGADFSYSSNETESIHRPTVIANNISGNDLIGVNTDLSLETEVTKSTSKAIAVAAFIPNKEKTREDAEAIKHAAGKGLHWMFGKKPSNLTENNVSSESPKSIESNEISSESVQPSSIFDEFQYTPIPTESLIEDLFAKMIAEADEPPVEPNKAPDKPVTVPKEITQDSTSHEIDRYFNFNFDISPYVVNNPFANNGVYLSDWLNEALSSPSVVSSNDNLIAEIRVEKGTIRKVLEWGSLYVRAFKGERSPEVMNWYQENRDHASIECALWKGFEGSRPSDVIYILDGMGAAIGELFGLGMRELNHLFHMEEMETARLARKGVGLVLDEVHLLVNNQPTRTGQLFLSGWNYLNDDFERYQNGEKTQSMQSFEDHFQLIGNTPAPELLRNFGKELGYLMVGEGLARGVGIAAQAAKPWLVNNSVSLEKWGSELFTGTKTQLTYAFDLGVPSTTVPRDWLTPSLVGNSGAYQPFDTIGVYHSVPSKWTGQSVLNGINSDYFSPKGRFGKGFYVSEEPTTTLYELANKRVSATHTIRYSLNIEQLTVLDLTIPEIAKEWGYKGTHQANRTQKIASRALAEGYNAIRFDSVRKLDGVNLVILKDFDALQPQMVVNSPSITPIKPKK